MIFWEPSVRRKRIKILVVGLLAGIIILAQSASLQKSSESTVGSSQTIINGTAEGQMNSDRSAGPFHDFVRGSGRVFGVIELKHDRADAVDRQPFESLASGFRADNLGKPLDTITHLAVLMLLTALVFGAGAILPITNRKNSRFGVPFKAAAQRVGGSLARPVLRSEDMNIRRDGRVDDVIDEKEATLRQLSDGIQHADRLLALLNDVLEKPAVEAERHSTNESSFGSPNPVGAPSRVLSERAADQKREIRLETLPLTPHCFHIVEDKSPQMRIKPARGSHGACMEEKRPGQASHLAIR